MKRLIVNADDFGVTRGVNAGIIQGFREGIITSTTLMANGAAFDDAVEQARANPKLGVGCHLVLVGGKSVARKQQIPSLADSEGNLPATLPVLLRKLSAGSVATGDVETELRAQVEKIVGSGVQPTHIDTHKHTHSHPRVLDVVVKVAEEFGIRRLRKPFEDISALLRPAPGDGWRFWKKRAVALASHSAAPHFRKIVRAHGMDTPEHFRGIAATGRLNAAAILAMIEDMPEGTSELMCHPGYFDSDLEQLPTRLKLQREGELNALTDPAVRQALNQEGVQLIDFRGLD
jgi:hopanoid biosynthesis associated protein HpnK